MGFEIELVYHKKENGKYNTEETKSLTKKIGDPFEDVPLEKLAAAILMQMARRDIMVIDVKITELKKQEIAFKEAADGIIIKNKKFTMESIAGALEQKDVVQTRRQQSVLDNINSDIGAAVPGEPMKPVRVAPQPEIVSPTGQAPKRVEIFDPQPDMVKAGIVKGKFTRGKRYPIFSEKRDDREAAAGRPLPILCLTIDDTGRQVYIPDVVFRPPQQALVGGNFDSPSPGNDGLMWDGLQEAGGIQDIRRGR